MSPAQKAGLVVGKSYYVELGTDKGQWVTFIKDDGSSCPLFRTEKGEEYYEFVSYLNKEPKAVDVKSELIALGIQLNNIINSMN